MKKVLDSIVSAIVLTVIEQGNTFPPVSPADRLSLRNAIFSHMKDDYTVTGTATAEKLVKLALACYDKTGTGYNGIKMEVLERYHNRKRLFVADLFKSTSDFDLYIGRKQTEKKTGCGNWLYGHGSLAEVREQYEKTGNYIKWDYHYIAKNEKEFNFDIHIFATWRQFFRYLDTYPNGYETFFKYNKEQSEKTGTNVYEMNTLKTSKKKVAFLRNFTK